MGEQHCILFICEALLDKPPEYIPCLLNYKLRLHCARSQYYLVPEDHHVDTSAGKLPLNYNSPHRWNNLQKLLKLDKLIPFIIQY